MLLRRVHILYVCVFESRGQQQQQCCDNSASQGLSRVLVPGRSLSRSLTFKIILRLFWLISRTSVEWKDHSARRGEEMKCAEGYESGSDQCILSERRVYSQPRSKWGERMQQQWRGAPMQPCLFEFIGISWSSPVLSCAKRPAPKPSRWNRWCIFLLPGWQTAAGSNVSGMVICACRYHMVKTCVTTPRTDHASWISGCLLSTSRLIFNYLWQEKNQ